MHRKARYQGLALLALGGALGAWGCSSKSTGTGHGGTGGVATGGSNGAGCPDVPSAIFTASCGNAGCHVPGTPAQGLDLVSPGVAARLVGQPSTECSGLLADPAHPEASVLYAKLLASPGCGVRMPLGQSALSEGDIACVKSWIAAQSGAGGAGGSIDLGGFGGFGGDLGTGGTGTCTDGLQNGVETDVDCGGLCPQCAVGQHCAGPTDCLSFVCTGGTCAAAGCADGAQDGMETDADCGGPACPPCAGGLHCLVDADCASGLCQPNGVCTSTCIDGVKDGLEMGVDCGGICPMGCPPGTPCAAVTDCASHICTAGACATPTCTDAVTNGAESDVDCGGAACAPCPLGKKCHTSADCAAGGCVGGTCDVVLYLGEVRTHGSGGFADEFVELYNPGSAPVTVGATWQVAFRNAQGGCQDTGYGSPVWSGAGQTIPPGGHLLIGGPDYVQSPAPDALMTNPPSYGWLGDAGSITVLHGGKLVDTMCFYYDTATLTAVTTCANPYPCAGTPVSNLPHNGSSNNAVDASLERKPGGALGCTQNTGDNAADFKLTTPAAPQNLASPPTP